MNRKIIGLTAGFALVAAATHAGITALHEPSAKAQFHELREALLDAYGNDDFQNAVGSGFSIHRDFFTASFQNHVLFIDRGESCTYEASSHHLFGVSFGLQTSKNCTPAQS